MLVVEVTETCLIDRLDLIIWAVITLAEGLGARVVGEGIETDEQRDTLRGLGCGFGQGYLFARPLERDDWLALAEQGCG